MRNTGDSLSSQIRELLRPIKQRLSLMVCRAIITAVSSTNGRVYLNLSGMGDENDVELVQPVCLSYKPKKDSEVLTLKLGGRGEGTIAILVGDSKYFVDVAEGEVCLHSYEHTNSAPHCVWLKAGRKVLVQGAEVTVKADNVLVDSGDVKLGDAAAMALAKAGVLTTWLSTHTHPVAGAVAGPSVLPTTGIAATKAKGS